MATHDHALFGIVTGDVEGIRRLLPSIKGDQQKLDRFAALAAGNGQLGVLKLLHEAGANQQAEDHLALRLSVATGREAVFDYLVERGAAVQSCAAELVKAAARNGHVQILERLRSLGCDLAPSSEILEELVTKPTLEEVRRYLAQWIPDAEPLSGLIDAIRSGSLGAVKSAIPGSKHVTHAAIVLKAAATQGSTRIVRYLYEAGSDLAHVKSAVLKAAAEGGHYDLLHRLITHYGCDPASIPGAADLAAENGHAECLTLLWTSGAAKHPISATTLKLAALNGHDETHDYLTYAAGMDSIAEHRAAINAMVARIEAAAPVYRPSELWKFFNDVNLEQLRRFGMHRFKRNINQNYFNYVPVGLRDPQLRGLLKHFARRFPIRTLLGLRMADPDRNPDSGKLVPADVRVFRLWHHRAGFAVIGRFLQKALYRLLVAMLWRYTETHDPLDLRRGLQEPALGGPIATATRDRVISQDLAHSILECNTVLDGIEDSEDMPLRVAEVGAGYGRVGDVLLSSRNCRYFVFDIPPGLHVSQWYLSSRYPHKRIFRFRDFQRFDEVAAELESAEIAFFTPDQTALFPDGYFDIVINISSLHEMRRDQMRHMLGQMYRISARRIYIKQYRRYENPWDKIEMLEKDYFVQEGWQKRLWRTDRVDDRFFEAVLDRDPSATPSTPARTFRAARRRPTVSVLLANYNDAKYLHTSLEGMLSQTDPADEIVVVDDGSTDDSVQVAEGMLTRHSNARVIRQGRNRGQHAAIQRALLEAKSEYVVWASSDDLLLPRFIERSRAALSQHPGCGLCFSRLCAWGDDTSLVEEYSVANHGAAFDLGDSPKYFSPEDLRRILREHYVWISGNTVLARRNMLLEMGGFRRDLRWHADWFSFYAIALRAGAVGIPETLAVMRERPDTYSRVGSRNRATQDRALGSLLDALNEVENADILSVVRASPSLLSPFGKQMVYAGLKRPVHWRIALSLWRWHIRWKYGATPAV